MSKFIFIAWMTVSGILTTASAQDPQYQCPKLNLIGPQGIMTYRQEQEFFVVGLGDADRELAKTTWTVSDGTIVKGGNTLKLTYRPEKADAGKNVTVSATVRGPRNCQGFVSGLFPVMPKLESESLDSWEKLSPNDRRSRLDALFSALTYQWPKNEGVLEMFFSPRSTRAYRLSQVRLVLDHLRLRRFDPRRISLYLRCDGGGGERTVVWTFPPGFDYSDVEMDESHLLKSEQLIAIRRSKPARLPRLLICEQ